MDQAYANDRDSNKEIIRNTLKPAGEIPAVENYVQLPTTKRETRNTKYSTNTHSARRKLVSGVTKNKKPSRASGKRPSGVWFQEMGEVIIDTVIDPPEPFYLSHDVKITTNLAKIRQILAALQRQINKQRDEAQARQDKEKEEPKPIDCDEDYVKNLETMLRNTKM